MACEIGYCGCSKRKNGNFIYRKKRAITYYIVCQQPRVNGKNISLCVSPSVISWLVTDATRSPGTVHHSPWTEVDCLEAVRADGSHAQQTTSCGRHTLACRGHNSRAPVWLMLRNQGNLRFRHNAASFLPGRHSFTHRGRGLGHRETDRCRRGNLCVCVCVCHIQGQRETTV